MHSTMSPIWRGRKSKKNVRAAGKARRQAAAASVAKAAAAAAIPKAGAATVRKAGALQIAKLACLATVEACLPVAQATVEACLPAVQATEATAEMGPVVQATADSRGADMLMAAVIGLISLLIWFGGLAVGFWMAQLQLTLETARADRACQQRRQLQLALETARADLETARADLETARADLECEQRRQLVTMEAGMQTDCPIFSIAEDRVRANKERAMQNQVTNLHLAIETAIVDKRELETQVGNLQTQVVNLQFVVERIREEKRKIEGDNHELRGENYELRREIDSINADARIPEVS